MDYKELQQLISSDESRILELKTQPHNQRIAEVLYKTSWLENWGTGIHRIFDACKEQNVPEPYFNTEQGYVTIVFPRPINNGFDENRGENNCETQLTERQLVICNYISSHVINSSKNEPLTEPLDEPLDEPLNTTALSQHLNIALATIKRDLRVLTDNGLIRRVGGRKTGHWEVVKEIRKGRNIAHKI